MKKRNFFILIIILIIIDQISKFLVIINEGSFPQELIKGVLELVYCENKGIAFGIGQGGTQIFSIITSIIIIAIIFVMCRYYNKIDSRILVGASLLISGGVGNLIDRIFRLHVIDFIYFKCINFPVFNFADICVVIGVIVIGISYLLLDRGENVEENNS